MDEQTGKKDEHKKKHKKHKMGFTNFLAILIMLFLAVGLAGGFYLALLSIQLQYTGALLCWTVVFTPIGTACSVVLSRIVDKSRAENISGNGDGIKYATAQSTGFNEDFGFEYSDNEGSPEI